MLNNRYFKIYLENPLKTYWKARKIFKFPTIKFRFWYGKLNSSKILDFTSFDLIWKWKFDDIRHESNPRIELSFFNKIHFTWEFTYNDNMDGLMVWEAILGYLYLHYSIQEAIDNNIWRYGDKKYSCEEFIKIKIKN